jgi:hypothetical protein
MNLNKKRYQECNWFIKRLRDLWVLAVPFIATYYFITRKKVYKDEIVDDRLMQTDNYFIMNWWLCWRIARGEIDSKRNYYYTHEEVIEKLNNIIK